MQSDWNTKYLTQREEQSLRNKWLDSTLQRTMPGLQQITNSAQVNVVMLQKEQASPQDG